MNRNLKGILQAVSDNDMARAKIFARMIVDADNTKANQALCDNLRKKLNTQLLGDVELPHDVRNILQVEDIERHFKGDRYYLSEREDKLTDQILRMVSVGEQLKDMDIRYVNSLLLHGESGTGKTMFGRYLAHTLGIPFVYLNFSQAISSYLGDTAKNIAKAFSFVCSQKCVFMLDEIDAIGIKRGREDVGEMSRIVISLMQALDQVQDNVIVVGATNRLDMLDSALLRRFSVKHQVKMLNEEESAAMVSRYLEDVKIPYSDPNIVDFCDGTRSQADLMNDVIQEIARSLQTGTRFRLTKSK